MDCNKDEATRAKEIAEKKFLSNDIAGAKKLALKAQSLYPALDGISQMLATLDVYVSAEVKINGEPDWYAILGLDPQVDDDSIKKQYRKLALILHPDKNRSVGADGAFKLISQAWNILSDREKRVIFDRKRNVIVKVFRKVETSARNSAATSDLHGFNNFHNTTMKEQKVAPAVKKQKDAPTVKKQKVAPTVKKQKVAPTVTEQKVGPTVKEQKVGPTMNEQKIAPTVKEQKIPPQTFRPPAHFAPGKSLQKTFWTRCQPCKMQFEYPWVYRNYMLLCPDCHQPFLAVDTEPAHLNGLTSSIPWKLSRNRRNSNPPENLTTEHSTHRREPIGICGGYKEAAASDGWWWRSIGFDLFDGVLYFSANWWSGGGVVEQHKRKDGDGGAMITLKSCSHTGLDLNDSYYYCKNFCTQGDDITKTGIVDADFIAKGGGALHSALHTQYVPPPKSPLSPSTSIFLSSPKKA
ncbi:hypothetical protein Tsubulata_005434 [Turnera subulata]|uniref:J domain-containing protein n=1 Tax=Turnera subulata TaxID=218843 RepID=A0A9Q0JP03_9ROSI|nr:hypothetical protein Tsubulata_005434 [Turnera subulata]